MSDVQTYYIAHVYQEQSSSKMVYNWNNMYWASNVFLAQLTNEGEHEYWSVQGTATNAGNPFKRD